VPNERPTRGSGPIVAEFAAHVAEFAAHAWLGVTTLARWAWPKLVASSRTAVRAGLTIMRAAWRHRAMLTALAVRGMWWTAMWLLWVGGTALLDVHRPLHEETFVLPFAVGFALCSISALLGAQRRIRWASGVLGVSHGALGLLALTALGT
jgi:hypothetical protein